MEIIFDIRENTENFDSSNEDKKQKQTNENFLTLSFTKEALSLGDVWFRHKETKEIFTMIERKSFNDFLASLKDGRWENQKIRYYQWKEENNTKRQVIYYLMNPSPNSFYTEKDLKAWKSAQNHLIFRENFQVVVGTHQLKDWMEWIQNYQLWVEKNIENQYTYRNHFEKEEQYQQQLQIQIVKSQNGNIKKRSDSIDPNTCFLSQLCCFPGISINIAQGIQKHFKNWKELIEYLESFKTLEEKVNNFENISCGNRKLGKVLAKKIIFYLKLSTDDEEILDIMLLDLPKKKEKKKQKNEMENEKEKEMENNSYHSDSKNFIENEGNISNNSESSENNLKKKETKKNMKTGKNDFRTISRKYAFQKKNPIEKNDG